MDLEGIARKLIPDLESARRKIEEEISFYKDNRYPFIKELVDAVVEEARRSLEAENKDKLLKYPVTGVRAGEAGLGSRGIGDHIVHEKILQLSKLGVYEDARVTEEGILASIDGIHSRLSYFPFLAGFHATRASLRDVMVKGGRPIGILIDIHLSDDSDVGMLLDFEAGVLSVAESLNVPILSGSTLRIGGDLVIGERISGGVGAIGVIHKKYFGRNSIKQNMDIVMTEGSGGGTIATTAIYNGYYDVVRETISIKDLITCKIVSEEMYDLVDSMTDVTNGGIRATANELPENLSLAINTESFLRLINRKVLNMLNELQIDVFGLSIDSILIFTDIGNEVVSKLKSKGINAEIIGKVVQRQDSPLITSEGKPLIMNFRESAYTPVKRVIGNYSPLSIGDIRKALETSFEQVKDKMEKVLKTLKAS
ncbi:AIR synthase related protein [Sulfolobus acidocaldarius]|uniref:Conserved Archaeal protein n=4 Tax=Sulfolobus acidocaldarius TaxID=2285 RepID=Q4JCH3_SULAC|nr:AIR synthase related protein [Sulfolobus acidocaldarius]AAY79506.1 conserved Archaeal protein [Sulfolobus acidocaldarius DSM 639]AGE70055.1 hypothetical protein SacN8_00370 [Sulfolobus acidocaldarius N8]AGE72330.1 hypothetical protein SacRon12I_00370 [Sulfolobus acidocaldarius Ron12/I]ALU29519.1 AIR synthase [Sulfolobus acidocaldarius]ALU32249.1 AIR synthase [Sulfolobus acidocaldarius]